MSYKNRSRSNHGYRSISEIRAKKITDIIFALIATVAIIVQLFLLFKYFNIRDEKKYITDKYQIAKQTMNTTKDQKLEKQRIYDTLNMEIESLESELERLKSQ
jgi:hypothetical protein